MEGSQKVFQEVFSQFWHRSNQGAWEVLLFETYQDYTWKDLWPGLSQENPEVLVFDASGTKEEILGTFGPFLAFLKQAVQGWSQGDVAKLLRRVRVYPPHRELFLTYLTEEAVSRAEDLILAPAEQAYERSEVLRSLKRLIHGVAGDRMVVFVLHRLDLMAPSVFRFLKDLLQGPREPGRVLVLGAFPPQTSVPQACGADWLALVSQAEALGNLLVMPQKARALQSLKAPVENRDSLWLRAQFARNFLAWEDGLAWMESLETWPLSGVSDPQAAQVLELWGELCLQGEVYDRALIYFEQALILHQKHGNTRAMARLWQNLGLLFFRKKDMAQAQRSIQQAWKLVSHEDINLKTRVLATKLYIQEQGSGHWSQIREEFLQLIQNLRTLGWENTLTQFLSLGTYVRAVYEEQGWDAAWREAQEALELARRQNNRYRISVALHTLGFIQEHAGKVSAVLGYFKKAIHLRQVLGDPLELIKVYNGTGYFCFSQGAFKEALTYFQKALRFLRNSREYVEICLTLFNVSLVYFFAHRWKESLGFLEDVLGIMDDLELEEIPWHTRAKLYAFAGIAAFHLENRSKGLYFYHRAMARSAQTSDTPVLFFLEGLLYSMTDPRGKGWLMLTRAREEAQAQVQTYLTLEISYQMTALAQTWGLDPEGAVILAQALDLAQGSRVQFQLLEDLKIPHKPGANLGLPLVQFDSRTLRDVARQEANLNQLHRKLSEIHFLHALQSRSVNQVTSENFLTQILDLLRNNTLASGVIFMAENPGSKTQIEFSTSEETWNFDPEREFQGLQTLVDPVLLGPSHPLLPPGITSLICLPLLGEKGILGRVFCFTDKPAPLLSENDLQLLSLAGNQIALGLQLRAANQKLILAATVDSLTGTWSRQELLRRLELEHQTRRESPGPGGCYSLVFLDMDNFKFINDTYGHQAGDLVLQSFAKLLQECTRSVDLVGRYGGDEFIMVLPGLSGAGAKITTGRILQKIRQGFLVDDLAQQLRRRIFIPPGSELSCSAGIITVKDGQEIDVLQVLFLADGALYKAKNAGKNQMVEH